MRIWAYTHIKNSLLCTNENEFQGIKRNTGLPNNKGLENPKFKRDYNFSLKL